MNPGITDVATYLAGAIPTGAQNTDIAVADWRETLVNARATNSMRPLADLVFRCVPEDEEAHRLVRGIHK